MKVQTKEDLQVVYDALAEWYEVYSSAWDIIHTPSKYYQKYAWCKANFDDKLINEYFVWKGLLPIFNKMGVDYYMGINDFVRDFGKFYEEVMSGERTLVG